MEGEEKMRNIIISAAMSICLPYLPIWEWDGNRRYDCSGRSVFLDRSCIADSDRRWP